MIVIRKIIVVLFLALGSCNGRDNKVPDGGLEKGPVIGNIRLNDMNGIPIKWEEYKGKTIFINFWATWCQPCVDEMPSIERAQKILAEKGVVFVLASREEADEIKTFSSLHNFQFNYAMIENSEELDIPTLPTTFIFDRKGKFIFSEIGSRHWDDKYYIEKITKIAIQHE